MRKLYGYGELENSLNNTSEDESSSTSTSCSSSSSTSLTERGKKIFIVTILYDIYVSILPEKVVYKTKNKIRVYMRFWKKIAGQMLLMMHL